MIPIVIDKLWKIPKGLVKRLEELEIWVRVKLEHCYWEESCWPDKTCCHPDSSESPSAHAGVKNSLGIIIKITTSNSLPKMKKIEYSNTVSENLQSCYKDEIWHRKMCHANNEKRQTTNGWRNRNPNQEKIRTLRGKETYRYLGILEVDIIKQVELEN